MSKEPAVIEEESVNPNSALPDKASASRKKELTATFTGLGHPEHEAERAFFQMDDRVPDDDLEALNFMLNWNGYASVMPEDYERLTKKGKKEKEPEPEAEAVAVEAKAEKAEKKK